MQVPLARIIELINNVAQRGMAVIKEPRLRVCVCVCVATPWASASECVGLAVRGGGGGQREGRGAAQTQELTLACRRFKKAERT